MKVTWTRNTYKGDVKKKTTKQDITGFVARLTWSGASTQASRSVTLSVANPVYDRNINVPKMKPGDIIKVYAEKEKSPRFIGRVADRQMTGDEGTIEVTAYDYMHTMLSSTMTKKFRNKTPEYITKAVLKDCGIKAGKIAATKKKIKKFYPDAMSPYDIIVAAYRKVKKKTGKNYFFCMDGTKFEVVEKGSQEVKTILEEKVNLTHSSYGEGSDGVVNKVVVYKNNKVVNTKKKDASIKKYGTIQQAISVEKGKGEKEAKNTLHGLSKEASISATGLWSCTAGKAVHIKDTASGLTGKYWITNDTHTFENGIHTMDLDLEFKEVTESVSVSQVDDKKKTTVTETEDYIIRKTRKNATFTGYYPGEGGVYVDADGNKLIPEKNTCAAGRSVSMGSAITVKETGTKYDGKTYRVTDRPDKSTIEGLLHIALLLPDAAACKALGTKDGSVVITKKTKNKNSARNTRAAKVVSLAKSYIGKVKYVFGAKNVPGGVSDCSGFTHYCFKQIGVEIGGDTIAQSTQARAKARRATS